MEQGERLKRLDYRLPLIQISDAALKRVPAPPCIVRRLRMLAGVELKASIKYARRSVTTEAPAPNNVSNGYFCAHRVRLI